MVQNRPAETDRDANVVANDTLGPHEASVAGLAERGAALANEALEVSLDYVAPLREAGQD